MKNTIKKLVACVMIMLFAMQMFVPVTEVNAAEKQHFTRILAGIQEGVANNYTYTELLPAWRVTNGYFKYNSSDPTQPFQFQLCEMYRGSQAEDIIIKENRYNPIAAENSQWLLMKFYVKNNSTQELKASSIINHTRVLLREDFLKGIASYYTKTATLSKTLTSVYDLKLQPGQSDYCWLGVLIGKTHDYPVLRIYYDTEGSYGDYTYLDTTPVATPAGTGDLDGDQSITLPDAQIALKCALNIVNLTDAQKTAADTNGDGTVSLSDAQEILRAALHIIEL